MDALIISSGPDTGGQNIRWKQAADRHRSVGLRARSVVASQNYLRYPIDIRLGGNGGAIRRLWAAADVIHLNNTPHAFDRFDRRQRKPAILHHHGTTFRTAPAPSLARARRERWPQAASTIDLVEIAPDVVEWLPTAYDLEALAAIREAAERPDDGIVRIAHAPTARTLKGTAAVISIVGALQDEGYPVELDVIEGVPWSQCLARKARADIFVDQMLLGFGCNAIEAWAMGIPVIAGVDPEGAAAVNHTIPDSTRDRMLTEFGGELPFYEASEATLADSLRALVADAELRATWAARGSAYVERFHAERPALERLLQLYQRALARDTAVRAPLAAEVA